VLFYFAQETVIVISYIKVRRLFGLAIPSTLLSSNWKVSLKLNMQFVCVYHCHCVVS